MLQERQIVKGLGKQIDTEYLGCAKYAITSFDSVAFKFDRAIKEEINEKTKSGIRLDLEGDDKNNAFSPRDTIRERLS